MKKGILSIAVVAASLFSFNAIAQDKSATPDCCNTPAQCVNAQACPANPQACPGNPQACPGNPQACPGNPQACPAQRPCADPFAGINLTQEQQTKLTALREKCKTNRAAADKARKDRFQQRDSMVRANKKQRLEEVKAILTPEQYVVFLENMVVANPGHDRGPAPHKMHAMKKGDKKLDMKRADRKGDKKQDVKRADKNTAQK